MSDPKILHLKGWGTTAMLNHALERIPDDEPCLVLFYEDGQLVSLSSHVDNQHAVWMCELCKLQSLHQCVDHNWE
jgi:hypothetical protein